MAEAFKIVMRMQGLWPKDLGGFEGHRLRKGGDLGHVDKTRSSLNRPLIGAENWAAMAQTEVADMAQENFANELESLKRRRRKAQMLARLAEGPKDPWRATRHGPMREIILTANRKWFEEVDTPDAHRDSGNDDEVDTERARHFEERAIAWLRKEFGDDVVHARADLDEAAYHIHAVILPRARAKDGRRVLQPSKFAVIRDYEVGQDSVGEFFADLGLRRGEHRAKSIRDALEHNAKLRKDQDNGERVDEALVPIPKKRRHVSPRVWRRTKELKLAEREKTLAKRERMVTRNAKEIADVFKVFRAVAEGGTPATKPHASDTGFAKWARKLLQTAFAKLRTQAAQEAEAEVVKARSEIEAADKVIVGIAKLLPEAAQDQIVEARPALSASITRLKSRLRKRTSQPPERDGGRS